MTAVTSLANRLTSLPDNRNTAAARAGRDCCRRSRGHDMPVRKKGGVRAPLRVGEIMSAYDHTRAGSRQPFHAPPYVLTRRRIETRCRLIEEHELRRMQQRGSELEPPRPTAG